MSQDNMLKAFSVGLVLLGLKLLKPPTIQEAFDVFWDKALEASGLELRIEKDVNLACMVKMAWRLMTEKESLWAKVLRSKYHYGDELIPSITFKNGTLNL
ncbi:hypothetical protein RJT34_32029 [Clitoria ternatea]|uniref:Cyclotide n=1 Tax=Clitoria ternatea TaxID=43366 RepID=A0AAN9EZJ2_CLITE